MAIEAPEHVAENLEGADLFCADTFDAETVVGAVEARPGLRTMLWTAEPMERTLRLAADHPNMSNVLGRANFDTPPRSWELMMVLRRLARPHEEGPKFAWFLDWGFSGFQERVDTSAKRDRLVAKVQEFAQRVGARQKIAELYNGVAHELLMNAMYDAPVDAQGNHKYAGDRKADIRLVREEQPIMKIASDGSRLAIQVTDPFGGLTREKVFGGIARGLTGGQLDTSHGGAGLGLTVIHNGTAMLFFDVSEGSRTEVTGIFELGASHRDFRLQPKSLHYFSR
ncbi:MAG: hypothetical protein GY811_04630 [Myxococcales bacterium]|nr:hypothetical protein [Myxococcales bacterium]